ncbi:protein kinase C substrate 80K-H [Schistosoma bovis]|uniref:Protein kinase C substrate 80K-H n=1 Tax=Schistosoma bovis TaxID=6184 RepID=A0A430QNT4_SCHBO|nr:protein kinase C substrate 80K-H [Schistosoma bovis]
MQTSFCLFCALFFIFGDIHGDELPKGVPLSRSSFYKVGQSFTCLDGSSAIPWWQVNDDYCDCRDGSDEPGTSACLNGRFFCRDMQYRPVYLPSAYVNDSICERKAKGLFNEDKQYDETLKLAEYDVNSDSSSSSSSNDNNDNDNEGSIQTNEENVDSHLSVGEEKQALNEPSSSSIDSNQQSFTHDNDNTLIEHEASSLSDTESHEKKASEYDGHHVGDQDSHMDYDESNVAFTDKQLDDESHHERKAKGLFNEDKQYDETLKLAEYDVNSDSSSSSSSNDNNDNDNEGSIQTNEENVDSHLSVGEEKQALNEPSSSSIDSNQQSFTHDNDNTLIEHEASSLSDTESHEKKASEYDGHHVGDQDNHMDYDESNVAVTDKQLDDESHHGTDECIDNDFSLF